MLARHNVHCQCYFTTCEVVKRDRGQIEAAREGTVRRARVAA
jgi:hypothetical protein